jgi:hypothetical protein
MYQEEMQVLVETMVQLDALLQVIGLELAVVTVAVAAVDGVSIPLFMVELQVAMVRFVLFIQDLLANSPQLA